MLSTTRRAITGIDRRHIARFFRRQHSEDFDILVLYALIPAFIAGVVGLIIGPFSIGAFLKAGFWGGVIGYVFAGVLYVRIRRFHNTQLNAILSLEHVDEIHVECSRMVRGRSQACLFQFFDVGEDTLLCICGRFLFYVPELACNSFVILATPSSNKIICVEARGQSLKGTIADGEMPAMSDEWQSMHGRLDNLADAIAKFNQTIARTA